MSRPAADIVAIDPGVTYEAAEVALILFHVTPRSFARRRASLRAEGFPEPITRWGRQLWAGQALLDWMNRERRETVTGSPGVISLQLAASALRAAKGRPR